MADLPKPDDSEDDTHTIALGMAVIAAFAICTFVGLAAWRMWFGFEHWQMVLKEHFAALVGLPISAL